MLFLRAVEVAIGATMGSRGGKGRGRGRGWGKGGKKTEENVRRHAQIGHLCWPPCCARSTKSSSAYEDPGTSKPCSRRGWREGRREADRCSRATKGDTKPAGT